MMERDRFVLDERMLLCTEVLGPPPFLIPSALQPHLDSRVLMLALEHQDSRAVQYLIQAGANPHGKVWEFQSLLHVSVRQGDAGVPCTEVLLRHGVSVDERDGLGRTPAHLAASVGSVEMLRLLRDNGADLRAVCSLSGSTVMHYAVEAHSADLVRYVGELPVGKELLDKPSADGTTPLLLAAKDGAYCAFAELVKLGANVAALDVNGDGLLHVACNSGMIKEVLDLPGVPLDTVNHDGRSPYTFAMARQDIEAMTLLAAAGIQPQPADVQLMTTWRTHSVFFNLLSSWVQIRRELSQLQALPLQVTQLICDMASEHKHLLDERERGAKRRKVQ